MSPFTDALYQASLHPTDRTTRELALREIGDLLEFGRWPDDASLAELLEHLVERALAEQDPKLRRLVYRQLERFAQHHPRPPGVWELGELLAVEQLHGPAEGRRARRIHASFGQPLPPP